MKKVFASRLLSLCKGRSIAECARVWGITQASLDRYVKALRTPTGDAVVAICKATGASADWLLGLSSAPSRAARTSVCGVPPDAASAPSASDWRDLAVIQQRTIASQQETVAELTRLLSANQKGTAPASDGGHDATKTA